jgi:hypothetical protein
MPALTRILNNQIYDSTIVASQKIAPGTITGSLFASNVTVPGDFLITGNLFVLGTSAYTTIASTNTYVNDPLVVLNNGFSGTNTRDEGIIFNRGSSLNQAFIWSEYSKEFRLVATSETGTTYGNVTPSSFANLHIGNVFVDFVANINTIQTTNLNLPGNILAQAAVFNAVTVNGSQNITANLNVTGNILAADVTFNNATAAFVNVIGNVNAVQVNAGSINTTGNILAQAAVFNSVTTNGNETVTGYVNVTGNILGAAGTLNTLRLNAGVPSIGSTDGGTFTVIGGAAVSQDLWVGGNLYVANIVSANTSVISVTEPLLYLTSSNVTPYNYEIGFYSHFYAPGLATANVYQHSGLVRDHLNNTWTFFSNVAEPAVNVGTVTFDANTIYDPIKAGNLNLVTNIPSTSTSTGTMIVNGGAGISGNLNAGQLNSSGNLLAQNAVLNGLTVNGAVNVSGNVLGGLAQFAALNATPIGNITTASAAVTTLAASAGIWANSTTAATNTTTGAVVVAGGVGLAGNVRAGGGAVFNSAQTFDPFQVLGPGATTLIYTNPIIQGVVIGGSNTSIPPGTTLKVNGNDSMMIPVGTSAQRPSTTGNVDVLGMMRFNTTINNLEFYDGNVWQAAGTAFTVVSDRQFSGTSGNPYGNVDGTNAIFTVQSGATTSGAMVSINGVLQIPTLAYSISGSTLTFTEAPSVGDVIDVRVFTATTSVTAFTSGNGLMQYVAADSGLQLYVGTAFTYQAAQINPVGDLQLQVGNKITYTQANVNIVANNTPYAISTWSQTAYTTAKYVVSVSRGSTNFQAMEALVLTDKAGNAYVTTYGVVSNGVGMGVLSANVIAGNVNLYFTTTTGMTNANVKAQGTYIV